MFINVFFYALITLFLSMMVNYSMSFLAERFLSRNNENSLNNVWGKIKFVIPYSSVIIFLTMFNNLKLCSVFFLVVFHGFLVLFVFLDSASRCLPRNYTFSFIGVGVIYHFSSLDRDFLGVAFIFICSLFVLHAVRVLTKYINGFECMGKGDIYLISGLVVWFDFYISVVVIIISLLLSSVFLLLRKYRNPICWAEQSNYRTIPFAPFVCVIAMFYSPCLIVR